jgi:predicted nucleic acid-binding protein
MAEHAPDPTRVVADADVLAADLLVGGPARSALDRIRAHSWLTLVATRQLFDDAEAVVRTLADPELAREWREVVSELALVVEQPPGDHPALAAAYHGDATHLVTFDERLQSVEAGATLKPRLEVSVRSPEAFVSVVDPAAIYELAFEGDYPGPDRDPRG